MSRLHACVAFAALIGSTACDAVEPQDQPNPPDVHGAWEISLTGYPVGTQGQDGQCELGPLTLELTQRDHVDARDTLTGTHSAGTLVCFGVTSHATQLSGIADTSIAFAAGTVAGSAGFLCDEPPGFVPIGTCSVELTPWVDLRLLGQDFRGPVAATMGGAFGWLDTVIHNGPSTVIYGTWSARR